MTRLHGESRGITSSGTLCDLYRGPDHAVLQLFRLAARPTT